MPVLFILVIKEKQYMKFRLADFYTIVSFTFKTPQLNPMVVLLSMGMHKKQQSKW